jgi:hypothetical protein
MQANSNVIVMAKSSFSFSCNLYSVVTESCVRVFDLCNFWLNITHYHWTVGSFLTASRRPCFVGSLCYFSHSKCFQRVAYLQWCTTLNCTLAKKMRKKFSEWRLMLRLRFQKQIFAQKCLRCSHCNQMLFLKSYRPSFWLVHVCMYTSGNWKMRIR